MYGTVLVGAVDFIVLAHVVLSSYNTILNNLRKEKKFKECYFFGKDSRKMSFAMTKRQGIGSQPSFEITHPDLRLNTVLIKLTFYTPTILHYIYTATWSNPA